MFLFIAICAAMLSMVVMIALWYCGRMDRFGVVATASSVAFFVSASYAAVFSCKDLRFLSWIGFIPGYAGYPCSMRSLKQAALVHKAHRPAPPLLSRGSRRLLWSRRVWSSAMAMWAPCWPRCSRATRFRSPLRSSWATSPWSVRLHSPVGLAGITVLVVAGLAFDRDAKDKVLLAVLLVLCTISVSWDSLLGLREGSEQGRVQAEKLSTGQEQEAWECPP